MPAHLARDSSHVARPFLKRRASETVVVALQRERTAFDFKPTSRLKVIESLTEELLLFDCHLRFPHVDEVEFLVKCPVIIGVFYHEIEIGRDPLWLTGRKVCTQNATVRVFVCELNGPDAGTGADVEDPVCFACVKWGEEEFVVLDGGEEHMLQVQTIQLVSVVGKWIVSFFVGMICAAAFFSIFAYRSSDGSHK